MLNWEEETRNLGSWCKNLSWQLFEGWRSNNPEWGSWSRSRVSRGHNWLFLSKPLQKHILQKWSHLFVKVLLCWFSSFNSRCSNFSCECDCSSHELDHSHMLEYLHVIHPKDTDSFPRIYAQTLQTFRVVCNLSWSIYAADWIISVVFCCSWNFLQPTLHWVEFSPLFVENAPTAHMNVDWEYTNKFAKA